MTDEEDTFFDSFSTLPEENGLLEILSKDSSLLTDALDSILESDWQKDCDYPLPTEIDGDFRLTDYIVDNLDGSGDISLMEDTFSNFSATSECSVVSLGHDHSYAQKPPIVSKTLVFKDGKASVKGCSERRRDVPMDNVFQPELTRVTGDEAPLVLQHEDGGYNSMSETSSPRSGTNVGSSVTDTGSEDGESCPPVKLSKLAPTELDLSHEEKEVLRSQGLPIPTCLPLTSVEKKALQMVRRKLKAKKSAKDNRVKRKEYVRQLEEEVRRCNARNSQLQQKVENLSEENKSLTVQLQTLQSLVSKCTQGAVKLQQSVNVGTCLSVVVLCFALIVANYTPVGHFTSQTQNSDLYSTNTVKARALLSIEYPFNSWLPEWSSKSREQCSNLLSVFLTLRFPKPYSLFDMYADPELNTADIFITDQ